MPLPSRTRTVLVTIYAIAAAAACVYLLLDALPAVDQELHAGPVDGAIDWIGARAFWEHVNPFSPEGLAKYNIAAYGFGHPPTAPFWFLPLFRWGVVMMGVVFGYLTLALLMLHLMTVVYDLEYPSPTATVALLFAAVLWTTWFQNHLHMSQLSEAIAFLYVLAWYFLRRDRQYTGGVMLGFATTFKLFPGVMVLFLLITRRWRAFFAACVSWLVIAVVMTWRYGLVCWPQFFTLQKPIADRWIADIRNSSLNGIVLRLFHPTCQGLGPVKPAATAIVVVLSLALLVGAWRLARPAERDRIDLPFALFAMLSTFINPWSWEHYNVLLILPLLLIVVALWRGATIGLPRWLVALGVAGVLFSLWAMSVSIGDKSSFQHEYFRTRSASMHWRLHVYEVANWLPQVLLMAITAALLAWQERGRRGAARRLIAAPAA